MMSRATINLTLMNLTVHVKESQVQHYWHLAQIIHSLLRWAVLYTVRCLVVFFTLTHQMPLAQISTLGCDKNVSRRCQVFHGGKNGPWLTTTGLDLSLYMEPSRPWADNHQQVITSVCISVREWNRQQCGTLNNGREATLSRLVRKGVKFFVPCWSRCSSTRAE